MTGSGTYIGGVGAMVIGRKLRLMFPKVWLHAFLMMFVIAANPGQASADDARLFFWWNDPVGPDDTVQVAGANLAGLTAVTVAVLDGQGVPSAPLAAEVVSVAPSMVKFILPKDLSQGVYRATLAYPDGRRDILLNRPTVYWSQGDQGSTASPGGWVTVVGRNIARSPEARLRLTPPGGEALSITPSQGDLWTARFDLPSDLKAGTYSAEITNGEGGDFGRAAVGAVNVAAPPTIGATVIGLQPSGADDTVSISDALGRLADQGGGTLRLDAGLYRMRGPLTIPPHVAIEGASRDEVVLNWLDDGPIADALISGKTHFKISNLTIQSNKLVTVIRGGFRDTPDGEDGGEITLADLTIRASSLLGHLSPDDAVVKSIIADPSVPEVYAVALAGRDLKLLGCDVLSTKAPFLLLRTVNALVRNNNFYTGRGGWYSIAGANGLLFQNNRISGIDLQDAGGGINTLDRSVTASQNALFDGNVFENRYGWDREAITTDGPGGFYFGHVSQLASDELLIGEVDPKISRPSSWIGAGVFVLSGTGVGQWAVVTNRDGRRIKVDRDFSKMLDQTSQITIVPMQRHYVFVRNTISDSGIGIQIYGTALEHVIAQNTLLRAGGIRVWGLVYKNYPQPAWFNQVLDNRITGSNFEGPSRIWIRATQRYGTEAVMNTGSIVRGNVLDANASVDLDGSSKSIIGVTDALVEANHFRGLMPRIDIRGGVARGIWRRNTAAP